MISPNIMTTSPNIIEASPNFGKSSPLTKIANKKGNPGIFSTMQV